jgi:hypothetical protein
MQYMFGIEPQQLQVTAQLSQTEVLLAATVTAAGARKPAKESRSAMVGETGYAYCPVCWQRYNTFAQLAAV